MPQLGCPRFPSALCSQQTDVSGPGLLILGHILAAFGELEGEGSICSSESEAMFLCVLSNPHHRRQLVV